MSATPTIVELSGVSKKFVLHQHKSLKERAVAFSAARKHQEAFWALRDIDLQIATGTTLGLVGHNGSGKSTLLKVIGGIIQPTTGVVRRRGRLAALLELGAGFHPDLTGRENVYLNASILGLTKAETSRFFDAIVDFSGIEAFIDTQVKFYSSGMYVRLAFAVSVHVDPDLLLIDEVLAVGDEPFQQKCLAKIAQFQREGRTIVYVSHSSDQVAQLCDRVLVLDHGNMIFDGSADEGIDVLRQTYTDSTPSFVSPKSVSAPAYALPSVGSLRISSSAIDTSGAFMPGSDLLVTLDFSNDDMSQRLTAEISIDIQPGVEVYRVSTDQLGIEIPREVGAYTLAITLPQNPFVSGSYSLRASLAPTQGDGPHQQPSVQHFSIASAAGVERSNSFNASAVLRTR